jgi:hypothetical protein
VELSPEHERQYRAHLEYFSRDAHVVVDGQRFAFTEEDLQEIAMHGRFFGLAGGLNSSVFSGIVYLAKRRFRPALARAQIIELCAATLKTTAEDVERSLEWTANYMAFHDGGSPEENHPYPSSEA